MGAAVTCASQIVLSQGTLTLVFQGLGTGMGWGWLSWGRRVFTAPGGSPHARLPLRESRSSDPILDRFSCPFWGEDTEGGSDLPRVTVSGSPAEILFTPLSFLEQGTPSLSLWPQPQLLHPGPPHRSTSPWCLERSQPALGPWVAPTGLHSKLHIVKGPRYMVPFVNCDVNHRCSALSWNAFWGVRVEVRGCPVVAKPKAL